MRQSIVSLIYLSLDIGQVMFIYVKLPSSNPLAVVMADNLVIFMKLSCNLFRNCTSGLPSDVTIEIGEMSFHLHKFPLLSRSGLLERRIGESTSSDTPACVLQLSELPGGAKSFELVAKFCYGVKIELSSINVVCLRCAAKFLEMTEEYGEGNLIAQTETFLAEVLGNWTDTIRALETCEEVLQFAEELHIVSRCINSLATTACANSKLFNWPVAGLAETGRAAADAVLWNGICTFTDTKPTMDDWWYEDVSILAFARFKRFIQAVEAGGMKPENIAGAFVFYAKRYIPQMCWGLRPKRWRL